MKQNIYDASKFFEAYQQFRQTTGANELVERPVTLELLGDVAGKRILELGCGDGRLLVDLAERGAMSLTGTDISEKMIDAAATRLTAAGIPGELVCSAMEDLDFAPHSFDIIVSSLALHYVADFPALLARLFACLAPGGRLVFSQEHPIVTASPMSWVHLEFDNGEESISWALRGYGKEGVRSHQWLDHEVTIYHRSTETILNSLLSVGFVLEAIREPHVPTELLPADLDDQHWPTTNRFDLIRPIFLFVAARKPKN